MLTVAGSLRTQNLSLSRFPCKTSLLFILKPSYSSSLILCTMWELSLFAIFVIQAGFTSSYILIQFGWSSTLDAFSIIRLAPNCSPFSFTSQWPLISLIQSSSICFYAFSMEAKIFLNFLRWKQNLQYLKTLGKEYHCSKGCHISKMLPQSARKQQYHFRLHHLNCPLQSLYFAVLNSSPDQYSC